MSPSPRSDGQAIPWEGVTEFMVDALPVAAVAHSHHIDALADPRLQQNPEFQRFSLIELNELHHQIGAMGALMRLSQGDTAALRSLGTNLAGFLQNRQAAMQVAGRFPPVVTQNPSVQQMMQLTQQSNQQIARNWPVLQQALSASRGPAPGPLLIGAPR